MSKNKHQPPPPKAPESKAADASAPAVPPADDDLQAQIAAQMASAEAPQGAAGAVEGTDSATPVTEPSSDLADASPSGEDAEEGDETPDAPSEPPAPGNLVTLHVSPNIDPTLAEAFGATPKASEPKAARFKVWSHGSLQCDGTTYLPGEALPFSAARIAALGIQHLAVPIED